MDETSKVLTIDDYILSCPEAIQPKLREFRQIILSVEPELTEKISWRMPAFCLGKIFIQFAAHKEHIGIYPGPEAIEHFSERLKDYKTSKGAIQIPNDIPLDAALITDLVKYNIGRIKAGGAGNKKNK